MKICAIICEFNPFHNGHKYLLEQAKKITACDAVICIMSGSFTQRGDMCVMDKYTRAKHAVLAGADCVIQLPAPFAVAPAEIFAKGAIKILSSIPEITHLAFGCESGRSQNFYDSAKLLLCESDKFKAVLNSRLESGESFIKSYQAAFEACGGDKELLETPNNVLGLEYTKALLRLGSNIQIASVLRVGGGYNDSELKENYSSASAIRKNITNPLIESNLPEFVLSDLKNAVVGDHPAFLRHSLFNCDAKNLQRVYGCVEGLENKLKSLANEPLEVIVEKATSKRYSSSRIKRILCENALGLYRDDCERFLNGKLYIKTLAVKKDRADLILPALAKSDFPLITDAWSAADKLSAEARECLEKDENEFKIHNFISGTKIADYMKIV